jgi:hypothetical protein
MPRSHTGYGQIRLGNRIPDRGQRRSGRCLNREGDPRALSGCDISEMQEDHVLRKHTVRRLEHHYHAGPIGLGGGAEFSSASLYAPALFLSPCLYRLGQGRRA